MTASALPKVMVFIRHYLPGFRGGGPIRSLANLIEALGDEFDFRVVTLDRDIDDAHAYPGIETWRWTPVGNAHVMYLPRWNTGFVNLQRMMRNERPDLIYLNSFFDPVFTFRTLVALRMGWLKPAPVILAPRGELSPSALEIKAWKKRIYINVVDRFGLARDVVWQASSKYEKTDIQRRLGAEGSRRKIVSDANIAEAIDVEATHAVIEEIYEERRDSAPLRICFLSRVVPMKNLDFALRALALARSDIEFVIHGPLESEAYWKECKGLIAQLPRNVKVRYAGVVAPDDVVAVLRKHDLFFLPTRGENFGHVINEAMVAGLPVLLSDRTPWRSLQESGVGWDLSVDDDQEAAFAGVIDEVATWSGDKFACVRRDVIAYATERAATMGSVVQNRALLLRCLETTRNNETGMMDK